MRGFKFAYVCRLCKAKYVWGASGGDKEHVNKLLIESFLTPAADVPMQDLHGCEDGSVGVADLQGAQPYNTI